MKKQKGKSTMKILLATDGSAHSNAAVKEIATRPFPTKTKVHIVSACEYTPVITTLEQMGVSQKYYAAAEKYALKAAEEITKNAAEIFAKQNSLEYELIDDGCLSEEEIFELRKNGTIKFMDRYEIKFLERYDRKK